MTNNHATYKIVRRPSVEEAVGQDEGNYHNHNSFLEQRFFTEKKINLHNHYRYHSGLKAPQGYKNLLQNSFEPLEEPQLQYSQTQLQNQMLKTLQDLGIRRGHSFQKQRIDFSLSSDVLNTQHENQILKKKMIEMKKELQFLRQSDEKRTHQLFEEQIKSSNLQNQLSLLKNQFMEYKQKMSKLQSRLAIKQQKSERILNVSTLINANQDSKKMINLLGELQNLKKLTQGYQTQIEKLKEQYQHQLNRNSASLTNQLQKIKSQFGFAKEIGQQQINKLMSIIFQKDRQIAMLKQKFHKKQISQKKKSTLVSENPENRRNYPKEPSYCQLQQLCRTDLLMERFFRFQRFIDQKISNNKTKERKSGQRISKSVIAGKKDGRQQSDTRLNQLQRQSNNFSLLLEKNQKLKYPDAVIERFHTDINHY